MSSPVDFFEHHRSIFVGQVSMCEIAGQRVCTCKYFLAFGKLSNEEICSLYSHHQCMREPIAHILAKPEYYIDPINWAVLEAKHTLF